MTRLIEIPLCKRSHNHCGYIIIDICRLHKREGKNVSEFYAGVRSDKVEGSVLEQYTIVNRREIKYNIKYNKI